MKMQKSVIMLLLVILSGNTLFASAFSFRVQCTKKGQANFAAVFNEIPERQTYIIQTGIPIYFSGGYFDEYTDAKERLDELHNHGISDAFIRVFKNKSFVSEEVSAFLLVQFLPKKQEIEIQSRSHLEEDPQVIAQIMATKLDNTYSRAEYLAMEEKLLIEEKTNEIAQKKKLLATASILN